jgi:hypothetical protein
MVLGASLISAGEAKARMPAKGRPLPSTTTIHFVPLPFLVLPTQRPLFCRREAAVNEGFLPVNPAFFVQHGQKLAPHVEPNALVFP